MGYFFLGAGPTFLPSFFISSSKRLRVFFQAASLSGTPHSPLPLQAFSPGCWPHPPWPLQAFSPWQVCFSAVWQAPWPAQAFFLSLPLALQVFRPRQTCG